MNVAEERTEARTAPTANRAHDADEAEEYRNWWVGELPWPLRDDDEFDTPQANQAREFDPEQLESVYAFGTAGHGCALGPEQLRDCLQGRLDSRSARLFVADVLVGMDGCDWMLFVDSAGVPVRRIAAFVRGLPQQRIHWRTVQALNLYTRSGQNPLPFELEKAAAGGAFMWLA